MNLLESSSIIIFPVEREDNYILCWKVELSHLEKGKAEAFYASAIDGSLIYKEETIRKEINGTVQGWIWPENYYDTWNNKIIQPTVERHFAYETVYLNGTIYYDETDENGYWAISNGNPGDDIRSTLNGPYVTIHHYSGSTDEHLSDTDYSWTWDDTTNHCDEYNVFYHVNLIHDYYLDNFGYEWDYYGNPSMDAYVYYNSTDAFYSGGNIYFGINVASGDPTQRYYARTSDVIYHEYTHAVKDDIDANDDAAIDEGFSDYFACTIVGESLYGEGYHGGRPLENNYLYPDDWNPTGTWRDRYYNGIIIAGGAWDLREDLGATITDRLIFEGLCNLGISPHTQDFRNLIGCILEADDDEYGDSNPNNSTPHQDEILDAFRNHHMYPSHYVFSGELLTTTGHPQTLEWIDDIAITGDVTVGTGVTLSLPSASTVTVNFANSDDQSSGKNSSKCEIIVNGTLQADDATFTATSKGDWYGIVFNSGASSSSYLKDCTIENAYNAVYIDGSDPTIENCEIKNADLRGIYIKGDGAQPTIKYCYIHDTDNEALYVYDDADPDVFENKLYAKFSAGASVYSADGLFCGNAFRTTSGGYGATVHGSTSRPKFNDDYYQGNLWDMSYISWSKAVYLYGGRPKFGDYPVHTGANDFLNIGTNEYYIWNSTGNTILAESNYWGAAAPDSAWFYGAVDRTPYESSSQNAGSSWKQSADDYFLAVAAYDKGDYKEALSLCEALLKTEPRHERIAEIAFLFGKSAKKIGVLGEKLSILHGFVSRNDDAEVAHVDRVWTSYYYASTGDMDKSRSVCLAAPQGSLSERELLLSLIGYYISNDDQLGAEEIADMLRTKRKDDADLETDIGDMLNSPKLSFEATPLPKPSPSEKSTTPDRFALYPAFPNPFNPVATIRFDLPRRVDVSLHIIDLLGRRVRALAENRFDAGEHSVVWDGRSDDGTEVAAGIYFARLRAGDKIKTIKMLLVR